MLVIAKEYDGLVSRPNNQTETTVMNQHMQAQMETQLVEQVPNETSPRQVGCNKESLGRGHQKNKFSV